MRTLYSIFVVFFLIYALFMPSEFAWSATLNYANIPVADRSAASFNKALEQAYAEVLIKLSGNPKVMTVAPIQNAQTKLKAYLSSYSYQRLPNVQGQLVTHLHAVFDLQALKKLLEDSGQTVWEGERGATLIILTLQADAEDSLFSGLDRSPAHHELQKAAAARGLAVIFPVMDLQDQAALNEVQDQALAGYQRFQQRYQVKRVLRVIETLDQAKQVRLAWCLTMGDARSQWESVSKDFVSAVAIGMDKLLETLASHFASMRSPKLFSQVMLEVTGVDGLTDYVHVVAMVRHLHDVGSVAVQEMNPKSLVLKVNVAGGLENLVRALAYSSQLIKVQQKIPTKIAADLVYHWQRHESHAISAEPGASQFLLEDSQDRVVTDAYSSHPQAVRVSS